jgi:hypothetical protein
MQAIIAAQGLAGQLVPSLDALPTHMQVIDQPPQVDTELDDFALLASAWAEVLDADAPVIGDWSPAYIRHRGQLARRAARFSTGTARNADHVSVFSALAAGRGEVA